MTINHHDNRSSFEALLARMWEDYTSLNPQARAVHELFVSRGEQVRNDHIALRTYDLPRVSIDVLERTFLSVGYEERGRYDFPAKRLRARHYEPPTASWPKIFISELKVGELTAASQDIVHRLVEQVPPEATQRFDFCAIGRPWTVSYAEYETLASDSEYGAWVAAFGFRPNHFTVDVGSLRTLRSIEQVNEALTAAGFVLNTSGGAVKGSPASGLEQSSVMARPVHATFDDGVFLVPGCYYEFAKRYPGPDGKLYQGFIAGSADRIFESTNARRDADTVLASAGEP
jgi:hypothetical protein